MTATELLALRSKIKKPFSLQVQGHSMEPILTAGQIIQVCRKDAYEIGDILVFQYKNGILVHRLLKIEQGRYFCKGDHAFRCEDLTEADIFGAVLLEEDRHRHCLFYEASMAVHRVFRKSGYDIEKTKKSKEYQQFQYYYLEEKIMYQKNDQMEFLEIDEQNTAVYDPESGDTHYINGTGKAILALIDGKTDINEILDALCRQFATEKAEIENDVLEFLQELTDKKVLCVL